MGELNKLKQKQEPQQQEAPAKTDAAPATTTPAVTTAPATPQTGTTPAATPPAPAPAPAGRLNPLGGWVHPLMQIMSAIKSSPDPSLQDAAQEAKDIPRSFANWATMGGADPIMAQIGQREPPGTPPWAQFNPDVQAQRAETAAARQRLGWLDTFTAKPLGVYAATRLGAPLEAAAPFAAPLVQMGGYGAGSSLISGERDPLKVGWEGVKSAAEALPFSLGGKFIAGPLAKKLAETKYGADTPEAIAAQAKQDAETAQQTAQTNAQSAQAQADAAKEYLGKVPLSRNDLGFTYTKGPLSDTPNPTYSDLQAELENIATMKPADDPGGVGPFLTQKINRAMQGSPEAQVAKSTAEDAAARAQTAAANVSTDPLTAVAQQRAVNAQQLADWNWQAKVKGMDVPGQALQFLKDNPNLPQNVRDAYTGIANSAVGGAPSSLQELIGGTLGSQAGKLAEKVVPFPFLREAGQWAGTKLAGAGGGAGATQQSILNAYPTLVPGATPGALQGQLVSDQARQALNQFMGLGQGFY
jgi:hypothetical protein